MNRFKMFSFFLITAYLLAACGGTLPQTTTSWKGPKVEANVVAFTGMVEAIAGNEWTVNGQKITLDPQTSLDPNIAVGDEVKVEARVLTDGTVVVLKVELSAPSAEADASSTPDPLGTPSPVPSAPQGEDEDEVFGTVEALTADTITVNGVTYNLADFTEFKDDLTVGDQVKVHVIVNADGTFTVREIEKSAASFDDDSNSGGSDDGPDHDADDDNSNDDSNDDSDDDSNSDNSGSGSNSGSDDD